MVKQTIAQLEKKIAMERSKLRVRAKKIAMNTRRKNLKKELFKLRNQRLLMTVRTVNKAIGGTNKTIKKRVTKNRPGIMRARKVAGEAARKFGREGLKQVRLIKEQQARETAQARQFEIDRLKAEAARNRALLARNAATRNKRITVRRKTASTNAPRRRRKR